ncbi:ribonuclease D [Acinetobacter sp. MD2(2019)]|uniref:ribonuclease D n=1 Tax=Acinetobacter sp. MD2(2019) TaxID=2605273 RepID=UPI002D1F869B|nr:HRDC domain-containing protein [Acinetobacter sp. MD2(2019)]MEB3752947.1 HRDC domain-containing protein [Acinetobacter sp. MD2(2019)]
MYQFIQEQQQLNHVLDIMNQSAVYALDSEFIKVDTFWPKLGVFQINVANQVYLLDGARLDLNPFWEKICSAKQNVFHACSEDIDLIYHYAKVAELNNVFDTQIAMSFLGHGLQVSYQNALKSVLNIEIEKDQTRSDWLARPLSDKQLCYAANDVIYLQQLSDQLQQQLNQKQLLGFVLEDCVSLTQEIAQETPVECLYLDVGNYRHSRRQLMQLQQLAAWREQLIKVLNVPRSFILKNATMIDLVEKNPKNHFQLSTIKQIRPNIIREYGKTILDLLKFLPEKDAWPLSMSRPVKMVTPDIAQRVEMHIHGVAQNLDIPKDILMRKKWLNELYHHVVFQKPEYDFSPYLTGWRYELLTRPLLDILQNDITNLRQQMKVAP